MAGNQLLEIFEGIDEEFAVESAHTDSLNQIQYKHYLVDRLYKAISRLKDYARSDFRQARKIKELENELEELKKHTSSLPFTQVSGYGKVIRTTTLAVSKAKKLEADLSEANNTISNLQAQTKSQANDLFDNSRTINTQADVVFNLRQENKHLCKQLADTEKGTNKRIVKLIAQRDDYSNKILTLCGKVEELKFSLKESLRKEGDVRAANARLSAYIDELKLNNIKLEKSNKLNAKNHDDDCRSIETHKSVIKSLRDAVAKKDRLIYTKACEIADQDRRINNLCGQIVLQSGAWGKDSLRKDRLIKSLSSELSDKNKLAQSLATSVSDSTNTIQEKLARIEALEVELFQERCGLNGKPDLTTRNAQLACMQYEKELPILEARVKDLEEENKNLEQINLGLETQLFVEASVNPKEFADKMAIEEIKDLKTTVQAALQDRDYWRLQYETATNLY